MKDVSSESEGFIFRRDFLFFFIPIVQGCLRQANYDIKAIFCCFDARTVRACQEKP